MFAHICRVKDDRLIKGLVFVEVEGKIKKGKPPKEWTDDIIEWRKEDLHILK